MVDKNRVLLVNYKPTDLAGELPYLCKRSGSEVVVFCDDKSWLLKNKFWDTHILTDSNDPKKFCKDLEDHLQKNEYDWVCLVDEKSLWVCAEHVIDEKVRAKIFPISNPNFYKILGSKCGLAEVLDELGIRQPKSIVTKLDEKKICSLGISYPFLIKFDKGGGGDYVFRCNSDEDVKKVCDSFPKYAENILVQEYIEGETISVETVASAGVVLAYAPSVVLKTVSNEFSVALVRSYFFDEKFEVELYDILKKLCCDGLGSLTFIKRGDEYFLIEVDLRANVWFRLADFVGIDFGKAIADKISGAYHRQRPEILKNNRRIVAHFGRNLLFILKNKDIGLLIKWLRKDDFRKFIPLYDFKYLRETIIDSVRAYLFFIGVLVYIQKAKRLFLNH